MQRYWFSTAAVLLCAAGLRAETPISNGLPAGDPMPGAVIANSNGAKAVHSDHPAPQGGAGCSTCSQSCRTGHGVDWSKLKAWLCYNSHRPHECTCTPTGYQPPLYAYFPCKGHGAWIAQCSRCDPRLFQVGLPQAPSTALPVESVVPAILPPPAGPIGYPKAQQEQLIPV